ncbi:MAG: hypothetical protein CL934_03410 [Deltaproteobacteria bacterium]|nr:hypothetical protein [Deltaproteobacteria bacterium]
MLSKGPCSNPKDWIVEYGNRLCAVHFKDLDVDGENTDEDGWADVGHGVIDWHLINQLLEKTPGILVYHGT